MTKLLDTDGDGHIGLQEFEEALEVMQKANGVHGAPWKLYVDPAQVCVWCHGVVTGWVVVCHGAPWKLSTSTPRRRVVSWCVMARRGSSLRRPRAGVCGLPEASVAVARWQCGRRVRRSPPFTT